MDVQELRPGLWRWTARHPEWDDREVSSAYRVLDLDADLVVPSHGSPFPIEQLAAALHD